jgi:hypothetical protein
MIRLQILISNCLLRRYAKEEDPERLLRLVSARLDNFDPINLATAFSKFGKICRSR